MEDLGSPFHLVGLGGTWARGGSGEVLVGVFSFGLVVALGAVGGDHIDVGMLRTLGRKSQPEVGIAFGEVVNGLGRPLSLLCQLVVELEGGSLCLLLLLE